ncbi:MAG: OmpA family protein [Saprospiraceae bacterium]|nr:OmpA family protein [Saprospiraceae bacterium]
MKRRLLVSCRILILYFIVFSSNLIAQPITLVNPSFEDRPRLGKAPSGWYDCGYDKFPGETPPDVQPGFFRVTKRAAQGQTFLGMVVRENETWESVSQRLSKPIEKGKCYSFRLSLCKSDEYYSATIKSPDSIYFKEPIVLRIWGGNDYCQQGELLFETAPITNNNWLDYNMKLRPKSNNYTYIMLEAFYKTPVLFPYNGNVLVDNASDIELIDCDKPLASNSVPKKEPRKEVKPAKPSQAITKNDNPADTNKPKVLPNLDRKTLKKGQTIRIDQLYFAADSTNINSSSYAVLDEVYQFLNSNQDVTVEIGGHTNGLPSQEYCDRISKERAKSVAEYLIKKGIRKDRVKYKGYGKKQPLASDKTADGRKKNQRVEIKILSIG